MIRNMSDGAFDVLSKITFDVLDIGTQLSKQAVNADLKQQHKLNGVTSYNSNDYERIAFSTHADARNFEQELASCGIECAVSTTKTHGQILVEVQKDVASTSYSNVYEALDNIQNSTGISYETPSSSYDEETSSLNPSYNGEINSSVEGVATSVARNFDEFGDAVAKVISLVSDVKRMDKAERNEPKENIVSENFVSYKEDSKGNLVPSANGALGNNDWNKESYTVINGKIKYNKSTPLTAIPITRNDRDRVKRKDECYFRSKKPSFIYDTTNSKGVSYKWQGGAIDKILTQVNTDIAKERVKKASDITQGNAHLLNALNNGFGLNLGIKDTGGSKPSINQLTQSKLIDVNNDFLKRADKAGFHLIGISGTFNERALNSMTFKDFKKMGINFKSVAEMNAFKSMTTQLNRKKSFGKTGNEKGLTQKALSKGTGKLLNDNLDAQTQKDIANMQMTAHYSKQVFKSSVRVAKAAKRGLSAAKHGITALAPKTSAKVSKAMSKLPHPVKKLKSKFQSTKVGKGLYSASTKLHTAGMKIKSARTLFGKYNPVSVVKKAIERAKETAKKFLVKVIIAPVAVIVFTVVVAIALYESFGSFLDHALKYTVAAYLKANTLNETIMFSLYTEMKDQEDMWLIRLNDFEQMYDNKDEFKYGIDQKSLVGYIAKLNEINSSITNIGMGDTETQKRSEQRYFYEPASWHTPSMIYISPFDKYADLTENRDLLTAITSYDGKNDVTITSNANRYGLDTNDVSTVRDFKSAVSSGHTCNIKDILAIIDLMYKADDDDSVLTQSTASATWCDWCNNMNGLFDFVKGSVISLFNTEERPSLVESVNKQGMNFDMVQEYASLIFEESHQNDLDFDMEFYDVTEDDITVKSDGEEVKVEDESDQKEFGLCTDPVKKDIKMLYDPNRDKIFPYIEYHGQKIPIEERTFHNIKLTMANLVDDDDRCLWDKMGPDEATLKKIKEDEDAVFNISCWNEEDTGTKKIYSDYVVSDYYDSEEEALNAVKEKLGEEWHTFKDKDKNGQQNYLKDQAEKAGVDGWDAKYELSTDHNKFIEHRYVPNKLQGGQIGSGVDICDASCTTRIVTYTETERRPKPSKPSSSNSSSSSSEVEYENVTVTKTKTQYSYSARQYLGDLKTYTHKRDCTKHTFKYCGGHLCVHSEGNVYSTTNEQTSFVDTLDNSDVKPLVNETNWLKVNGYKKLYGKYDAKLMKKRKKESSTFAEYIRSGSMGYGSAHSMTQGSDVASGFPVNLKSNGSSWDTDFGKADFNDGTEGSDQESFRIWNIRDIFDVDCYITKGFDVFQGATSQDWKDYEGWTIDNVEQAITKISADWYGLYNFDIPIEIANKFAIAKNINAPEHNSTGDIGKDVINGALGVDDDSSESDGNKKPELIAASKTQAGFTLCDEDINKICKAVGVHKGTKRYKIVKLALEWVGRGHYAEGHDHDFLSSEHKGLTTKNSKGQSVSHDGCCTAGDSEQFVNYILQKAGVKNITNSDGFEFYNGRMVVDNIVHYYGGDARPGDVLIHKPITNEQFDLHGAEWDKKARNTLRQYKKVQAVIYIGKLSKDLILSTGQTLHIGVPIVVDLNQVNLDLKEEKDWSDYFTDEAGTESLWEHLCSLFENNSSVAEGVSVGNIYIHGSDAANTSDYDGESTYYWITHPNDSRTYKLTIPG